MPIYLYDFLVNVTVRRILYEWNNSDKKNKQCVLFSFNHRPQAVLWDLI